MSLSSHLMEGTMDKAMEGPKSFSTVSMDGVHGALTLND
jgi:hypothetical protein